MVLASGPCFAAPAPAPGAVTLGLCFAAMEFFGLVWNVVSVSTRQRLVPGSLRGRVNSPYSLLAWGMMPLRLGWSFQVWSCALARPLRPGTLH